MLIFETIKDIAKNIKSFVANLIDIVLKGLNNIAIWIFLVTIVATSSVIFFVNIPIDYDVNLLTESRDYIVNKRSLKVHIGSCYSVTKMSEKNKFLVNDTLENLLSKGYYVCNRCKAGIKRKNEKVASFLENVENVLFANEEISFKLYDEYLNSIDEMGEWYVNHIPTYQKKLSDNATKNAIEYF